MNVVVFGNKFNRGINGIVDFVTKPPITGTFVPLEIALNTSYDTDAHFVPYYLGKRSTKAPYSFCRVNKRFGNPHYEVFVTCQVFDVDMPDHKPLELKWATDIVELIFKHTEAKFCYLTNNGLRFIIEYPFPIECYKHEEMMRESITAFREFGIPCDWLFDYTRYFRLPFVKRDNQYTKSEIISNGNYKAICKLWRDLQEEETEVRNLQSGRILRSNPRRRGVGGRRKKQSNGKSQG